jgi:hypothetical protein
MDEDAVMVRAPYDGAGFASEGPALVEVETDDGLVHQYVRTQQSRDGKPSSTRTE